jgi:hypothetical protein
LTDPIHPNAFGNLLPKHIPWLFIASKIAALGFSPQHRFLDIPPMQCLLSSQLLNHFF